MSTKPQTSFQALENLKNQAFNVIFEFAKQTTVIVNHAWVDAEYKQRSLVLASYIKKDLQEFRTRLADLDKKLGALPGKVREHPHHPSLLGIGGMYMNFIEDLQTTVGSRVGELVALLADDNTKAASLIEAQVSQ